MGAAVQAGVLAGEVKDRLPPFSRKPTQSLRRGPRAAGRGAALSVGRLGLDFSH